MESGFLAHLGVSLPEEMVYRGLLRHPRWSAEDLVQELTFRNEGEFRAVLDGLVRHGMVRIESSGRLAPTDPAIVVERLVATRLEELHEQLRETVSSRHLVEELLAEEREQREEAEEAEEAELNRIVGLDEVRARIEELTFFCHRELLSVQPNTAFSAAAIAASRDTDLRCLRRKIVMRTIVRPESMQDAVTAAYLRDLVSRGAAVRLAEGELERVMIFDRKVALVPFDPNSSARGALLIRQPVLVSNLVGYFERVWATGVDVPGEPSDGDREGGLTELDQHVLRLMAAVDKDEIGARELGVSVRTYRTYIARIMSRLEASNRFQAALRARENGWI